MMKELDINFHDIEKFCANFLSEWNRPENKVFVLRNNHAIKDVKEFYSNLLKFIGKPYFLAEDANIKEREMQRTGELWFDVKYDSQLKDAFRHSSNAQPLHTDGSYIPSFPNATLMCCNKNSVIGGETVFLDGVRLVECLIEEKVNLYNTLVENVTEHARSGDKKLERVIRHEKNQIKLNWNYYCLNKDHNEALSDYHEEFFLYLQTSEKLNESIIAVTVKPGDAMIWKDSEVLHGRNSFIAKNNSARHLYKCAIDIGNLDS